jgi:FKBP-type peptidyl-prolyl cis-trans isomerase
MRSKWITYAIMGLIVYSVINKQEAPDKKPAVNKEINKAAHSDSITSNIIELFSEKGANTQPPNYPTQPSKPGIVVGGSRQNPGFVEKKIYAFLSNLLDSDKGRELIDKIMTIPATENLNLISPSQTNPYINNTSHIISPGIGEAAICGQSVKVHYIAKSMSGDIIADTKKNDKPATFLVGSGDIYKGIEYAVIGMKKSGSKKLILPPSLTKKDFKLNSDNNTNDFIGVDLELLEFYPSVSSLEKNIQIFDKNYGERNVVTKCGDQVGINYKIKKIDGSVIFDSMLDKKLSNFTIGSQEVPFIINKLSENMGKKASRSAITPIEALNNIYNKPTNFFPKAFTIPKEGFVVVDIEMIGKLS